jgi:glycosyltransferase involved in cell wall biosynthesis
MNDPAHPMRVQLVDPSAFTPPYDHALARSLVRQGAEVELITSPFLHGAVPAAEGYRVTEFFYRRAARRGKQAPLRRAFKLAEHFPDMLRLRRYLDADVVHYQWLTLPGIDAQILPPQRPRVLTAHYILPPRPSRRQIVEARRAFSAMDAVITHSSDGRRRLHDELGIPAERIHLIRHGVMDYLTRLPGQRPLPAELEGAEGPVILFFGLLRMVKGIDTLLEAFQRVDGAELWVVGMPRMALEPLEQLAESAPGRVRFLPRFVDDEEIPAIFSRADIVALPHRDTEHSGVLHVALAFGKPLVMTEVGGLPEVGRDTGAARIVPPDDPQAMAAALQQLVSDEGTRKELAEAARRAASGPYSWEEIARETLALYGTLLTQHR